MVLNATARLVVGASEFDHVNPVHHDVINCGCLQCLNEYS